MLEARTVAVVGASDRPDSFGWRMTTEVLRSPGFTRVHLINPGRSTVLGEPCLPSLADVPNPVDLVLLGVPDAALVDQVRLASARGDAGAVVFGSAHGVRDDLVSAAAGLELCGAGCMGFINVTRGVRAIGYLERDPLPPGPIALVTHSGSVFSAMLRTHRRLHYSLVVSSGQELVTTTADYLAQALSMPETQVIGLVLETLRDVPALRAGLAAAAERDIPVVALTVGSSVVGTALVDAHSGALAGSDAAWEALFAAYGVHRCDDLATFTDSLELFAVGRRIRHPGAGIATVHDSGAERVLVADVAERTGVPFAPLAPATTQRLTELLDPGLQATNPLDVWGGGASTEDLFTNCLTALADDAAVEVVALAVDLVTEYDGDDAFPRALTRVQAATDKPVVVLSNLASAIDQPLAATLRAQGIPVLEGTRSGLIALRHLREQAAPALLGTTPIDLDRQRQWTERLVTGEVEALALLMDYGVSVVHSELAASEEAAVAVARRLGHPVVLKTANPEVSHKVDVDGVWLGLADDAAVRTAYAALGRLGAQVEVQRHVPAGVELAIGIWRDPLLGPLLVVAAGGTLVELLDDRVVALAPVTADTARDLVARLKVARLLAGHRGTLPGDLEAVVDTIVAVSDLAHELGDQLDALDVNPLIVTAAGAVAVDALVLPRRPG
ncbi:acetate--CoA ligase family protein [Nocardioides sp.]|uniref:acetate--CoA ligase family protein n=1 Tax=Nocardioides sp. TaxID=35761 RepID=UPI003D1307A5